VICNRCHPYINKHENLYNINVWEKTSIDQLMITDSVIVT